MTEFSAPGASSVGAETLAGCASQAVSAVAHPADFDWKREFSQRHKAAQERIRAPANGKPLPGPRLVAVPSLPEPDASIWHKRAVVIAAAVCVKRGLVLEDVMSNCRSHILAHARQEVMWVLRNEHGIQYERIGKWMNYDHTTVFHGVRRHQARLDCAYTAKTNHSVPKRATEKERISRPDQTEEAFSLWEDGFDTYDIATCLDVSEAAVYNSISAMRETLRGAA